MKNSVWLLGLFLMSLLAACSDKEVVPNITLATSSQSTIAFTEENTDPVTVTFSSTKAWTAASAATWLSVSPKSGDAGDAITITISTKSENTGTSTRTGYITLASEGTSLATITVTQDPKVNYYATFEQSTYVIPAEGAERFKLIFTTNCPADKIRGFSEADWIQSCEHTDTRATDATYYFALDIDENTGSQVRSYNYYVCKFDGDDSGYEILSACTITQQGKNSAPSEDYSADGRVTLLQAHTEGDGLLLVLMGDGFTDADIADGWYNQVMDKAIDNLFSEEPIKSLRNYFDIYQVDVVSKNNIFGEGYETALGCTMDSGSSLVEGDDDAVLDYCDKIEDVTEKQVMGASVVVVLNTNAYGGTTYWGYAINNKLVELSIAYCPIIYGLDDDEFHGVLVHEAIGHGFGKLLDEYAYESQGEIPTSGKNDWSIELIQYYQSNNWNMNVDFTTDTSTVLWHEFLADSRYADEGLGIFEGGATFWTGVYRPSENSMMRFNDTPFNAPSRQALYKRVMRDGLGNADVSYEDFVQFDLAHPYTTSSTLNATTKATKSRKTFNRRFAAPRFVNKEIKLRGR